MHCSETIGKISAALQAFQASVGNIPKTATNPHFKSKFAPLDEIVAVINQKGPEHGLSHVQSVGSIGVITRVMHESGEWIESDPLALSATKADPQGEASAITYARRYQLPAMYGLATEEDDDANRASVQPHVESKTAEKPKAAPEPTGWDAIVESANTHGTREAVFDFLGKPKDPKAAYDKLPKARQAAVAIIAAGGTVA
jgi:hypothetical protein